MTDSTEIAVREPTKVELTVGGDVGAIIPRNIEEVFRLAQAINVSKMAPKSLDTTEKVMVAILAGSELGLAPFQAIQSFALVNGRATIWGDGMLAVVRSHGFRVREWFDDDDMPTKAFCEVTRPDNGEVIERTYSLADARKANLLGKEGSWQTNQKRMLQMRARAFACRDGAADVLRGYAMREEVNDYSEVRNSRPEKSDLRARLEANKTPSTEGFLAENGEPQTVEAILEEGEFPVIHHVDAEVVETEDTDAIHQSSPNRDVSADGESSQGGAPQSNRLQPGQEPGESAGHGQHAERGAAQDSGSPPDTAPVSLESRIKRWETSVREATSKAKLEGVWAASASLRNDVDIANPERAVEMEAFFNARYAEVTGGAR